MLKIMIHNKEITFVNKHAPKNTATICIKLLKTLRNRNTKNRRL